VENSTTALGIGKEFTKNPAQTVKAFGAMDFWKERPEWKTAPMDVGPKDITTLASTTVFIESLDPKLAEITREFCGFLEEVIKESALAPFGGDSSEEDLFLALKANFQVKKKRRQF